MKRLIVNADDLGRSAGVDRGILRAFHEGIVRSATLMPNLPRAREAAALVRDEPALGVGVHLVLTYGSPLSAPAAVPSLVRRDGSFTTLAELRRGHLDEREVIAEFRLQIDRASELLGRAPTHLDTHHWVQDDATVARALAMVAKEHGLAARSLTTVERDALRASGVRTTDRFTRDFHGTAVTVESLTGLLARLPEGSTELMCHPGELDAELSTSSYATQRPIELATLTDQSAVRAVRDAGFELATFADL